MSTVKIVQIVYVGDDGATQYLDDKGRVWWQKYIYTRKKTPDDRIEGFYEWRELNMPEEPEE